MNNLTLFAVQYRWHIRRGLLLLTLSVFLMVIFAGIFTTVHRVSSAYADAASLRIEVGSLTNERNLALDRADKTLGDFSEALKDREIQQIYIKPLCHKLQ